VRIDFIIGIPRSGTTLLSTRFRSNPNVLSLLESKLSIAVIKDVKSENGKFLKTEKLIVKLNKKLHKTDYSIVNDPLLKLNNIQPTSAIEAIEIISSCIRYRNHPTAKRVIDKNPQFTWYVDKISNAFPSARFIIMNRDPRGFVLSKRQKRKKENFIFTVSFLAILWRQFQKKIKKIKAEHGGKTTEITYEKLCSNPELELECICKFLDLQYSKNMLEGHELNIDYSKNFERKKIITNDLSKNINTSRLYAWKTELNRRQILRIEVICRREIKAMKYNTEFNPSILTKYWILVTAFPFRALAELRMILIHIKYN
jgi:hypothetical protein